MKASPGDVIQIDGGLVIVTSVKGDKAEVLPVSDFKGRQPHALKNGINAEISRDRLFESRGEEGLAAFIQARSETDKHKGFIKLEPGDQLCHGGELRTVISVTSEDAIIGNLAGQEFSEERWLNEYFFQDCTCHKLVRLNAEQRATNLKQFLQQRKSPLPEAEECNETEKPHIESMKAKTKSKSPKPAKEPKSKPAAKSFAGSSTYIRDLIAKGSDKAEVIIKVTEKYGMPERMIVERFEAQSKLAKGATA